FFFQAEDGIRDATVTGVQTCALPICVMRCLKFRGLEVLLPFKQRITLPAGQYFVADLIGCSVFETPAALPILSSSPCSLAEAARSEERRVGEGCGVRFGASRS